MSTVSSGLASKGEKSSKPKFSALNINNLYKGKSLETPRTAVVAKHGLQTLGKVGAGRRIPPPANLPSLTEDTNNTANQGTNSNNNNNNNNNSTAVNLVPSGGSGWAKEETNNRSASPIASSIQKNLSSSSIGVQETVNNNNNSTKSLINNSSSAANAAAAVTETASKTWCNSSARNVDSQSNLLAHQSPFFPQEFPTLNGADTETEESQKARRTDSPNTSHGPGPNLRPLTEGSWTRGTAIHTGEEQSGGGHPSALLHDPEFFAGRGGGYPPPMGNLINCPLPNNRMNMATGPVSNILTGSSLPINPQFRQMMQPYGSQYLYNRNPVFPPGQFPGNLAPNMCPYPPDPRLRQQHRNEEDSGGGSGFSRPAAPILTDKDLKGFDEILEDESHDEWAAAHAEIDYNAKLVFSDEEDADEASDNAFYNKDDTNSNENRSEKGEHKASRMDYDVDEKDLIGNETRRLSESDKDGKENQDKNERPKYRPPAAVQMHSTAVPYERHAPFPTYGVRNRSDIQDDDEVWKMRSRQHSDEMSAAVARARQRREEEEKKYNLSRLAAIEKARLLGEKETSSKVSSPKESQEKEIIEIKPTVPKEEIMEQLLKKEQRPPTIVIPPPPPPPPPAIVAASNFGSKPFTKELPPRFQRQLQMQQNQKQSFQSYPNAHGRFDSSHQRSSFDHPTPPSPHGHTNELKTQTNYIHSSKYPDHRRSDNHLPESDMNETERPWRERPKASNENWRSLQKEKSIEKEIDIAKEINDSNNHAKVLRGSSSSGSIDNLSTSKSPSKVDEKLKPQITNEKQSNHEKSDQQQTNPLVHSTSSSSVQSCTERNRNESFSNLDSTAVNQANNVPPIAQNVHVKTEHTLEVNQLSGAKKTVEDVKKEIQKNLEIKNDTVWNVASDWNQIESEFEKDENRQLRTDDEKSSEEIIERKSLEAQNTSVASTIITPVTSTSTIESKQEKTSASSEAYQDTAERNIRHDERYSGNTGYKQKQSEKYHDDYYRQRHNNYRGGVGVSSREYRRSRGSSDRYDNKYERIPHDKLNKMRRDSHNSSESLLSDEGRRRDVTNKVPHEVSTPAQSVQSHMALKPNDQSSISLVSNAHDMAKQKQQAVTNLTVSSTSANNSNSSPPASLRKVIGPSNYGPPPTKAAFGDSRTAVSASNNDNKNSDTTVGTEATKFNPVSAQNINSNRSSEAAGSNVTFNRNVNVHSNRLNQYDRGSRDHFYHSRSTGENSRHNPERFMPPRFQKKIRGGKIDNYNDDSGNKHFRGNPNRTSRTRTSSNQESDVGNDEWETASESSDLNKGDRRNRSEHNSKFEPSSRGGHSSRGQGTAGGNFRRSDNKKDYPRSQPGNDSTDSANRGQKNRFHGRQSNERDVRRNTQTSALTKNENITILAVNEMKLDDPKAVGDAISNYQKAKPSPKDDDNVSGDRDDGFQKVRKKKREGPARLVKLPPRFAKQKESRKSSDNLSNKDANEDEDKLQQQNFSNVDCKINSNTNSWNTYLSHTVQATTTTLTTTVSNTAAVAIQAKNPTQQTLSLSSKSSSFDQQDSGIDVSDQQNSAASSQRSSPSNDDKAVVTTTTASSLQSSNANKHVSAKPNASAYVTTNAGDETEVNKPMCTVIFENKNLKAENAVLSKKGKDKSDNTNVGIKTDLSVCGDHSAKSNSSLNEEKRVTGSPVVNKSVGVSRCDDSVKNAVPTDELNIKIASVKKVWDCQSMPALLETPSENEINESMKCEDNKVKQATPLEVSNMVYTTTPSQNWPNSRVVHVVNQEMKMKNYPPNPTLSSQMQQIMLHAVASNSQEIQNQVTEGLRQMQNFHMQGLPPISSPPNLIYNAPAQMAPAASGPNMYQSFPPQMKNFPQLVPQYAPPTGQTTSAVAAAYHQHMMTQQGNAISQTNIFVPTHPQTQANPMAADRYRLTPQPNLAAQLLKSQFVPASAVQNMHRIPVGTTGFYQASTPPPPTPQQQQQQQQQAYFQQANVNNAATMQQQHQYAAFTAAQPQVLPSPAQVGGQAAYRAVQMPTGRPGAENQLRPVNGKYASYR